MKRLLLLILFVYQTAFGTPWLTGWSYRGTYTLPATAGTETDLNFRAIIPYDANMQADFDDIRFADSDGLTLLEHDKFEYTASTTGTFWFKVPSKPAAGQLVYVYWGNSGAPDVSDPANVYQAYDGFSGDLSKWTNPQPTEWYISSGVLRGQGQGIGSTLKFTGWTNNFVGYGFFARVKHDYPSGAIYMVGSFVTNTGLEYFQQGSGNTCNWSDAYATAHFGDNTWGNIEIGVYSATLARHYKNGALDYTDVTVPTNANSFGFYTSGVADAGGLHCDYVYIFKLPSDGTEITDYGIPDDEEWVSEPYYRTSINGLGWPNKISGHSPKSVSGVK